MQPVSNPFKYGILYAVLLSPVIVGCARTAAPLEELGAAKMAVNNAEKDDHTLKFAAPELQMAREKVASAEDAISRREHTQARRLSEQAIVDAQLAQAKTDAGLSTIGAMEVRAALQDLQQERAR